jgi:hypothetical protein
MTDLASPPYRDMVARITVPIIIAAFLVQPDLSNMSALERLVLAATIMAGLILVEASSHTVGFVRAALVALAITPTTAAYAFFVYSEPMDRFENDKRCMAIQIDMLSAQPRREDAPDLFQALGCRPHGEGRVFAKPTKLERAAGHALPEGGRH